MSFTYLIGSLLAFCLWILIYVLRKDMRRQMVIMSAIVMCIGLIMEYVVWTTDWWNPRTITGTRVGFEDALLGFALGGIVATLYPFVFRKKLKESNEHNNRQTSFIIGLSISTGFILWVFFNINSSIVWIWGTIIPTIAMYYLRKDIISQSLWTGFLVMLLGLPVYWILYFIEPSLFTEWWMVENLTGITILKVPLEDYTWLLGLGLFFGPIYEFWHGGKLVPMRNDQ